MNHSPVLPTYPPTRRAPRATPVPTCPLYQSSSLSPYMTRRAAHDDKSDAAVMEHLQQAPPSSLGRNADPATSQPHADGAGTVRRMRSRHAAGAYATRPTSLVARRSEQAHGLLGHLLPPLGQLGVLGARLAKHLPRGRARVRLPGDRGGRARVQQAGTVCAGPAAPRGRRPARSQHSGALAAGRQGGKRGAAREVPCTPRVMRMQGATSRTFSNSASSRYASRQSMSTPSSARRPARARAGPRTARLQRRRQTRRSPVAERAHALARRRPGRTRRAASQAPGAATTAWCSAPQSSPARRAQTSSGVCPASRPPPCTRARRSAAAGTRSLLTA